MRISVSDLQAFRRYRLDEDMPLGVLLRQLRREDPPTLKMRAGSALHRFLETADPGTFGAVGATRLVVDGHAFTFSLDDEITLPAVREIAGTRDYLVNGIRVTLSARADGLTGTNVQEHKFTASAFDAERYADSYQWRCYLVIFYAQSVTYNVFTAAELDSNSELMEWDVRALHQLTLYRYPGIEDDVRAEVERYAAFAQTHLHRAA